MAFQKSDLTNVRELAARKGVGGQRWQRPSFESFLPPRNHASPTGENIQAWFMHAQAGDYETPSQRESRNENQT